MWKTSFQWKYTCYGSLSANNEVSQNGLLPSLTYECNIRENIATVKSKFKCMFSFKVPTI